MGACYSTRRRATDADSTSSTADIIKEANTPRPQRQEVPETTAAPTAAKPRLQKEASVANDTKSAMRAVWAPEYEPLSILPQATSYSKATSDGIKTVRSTAVSLNMIMTDQPMLRKAKVTAPAHCEAFDIFLSPVVTGDLHSGT